jgi:hypothetical protein
MSAAAGHSVAEIGGRLEQLIAQPDPAAAEEMLGLGEEILEHWQAPHA